MKAVVLKLSGLLTILVVLIFLTNDKKIYLPSIVAQEVKTEKLTEKDGKDCEECCAVCREDAVNECPSAPYLVHKFGITTLEEEWLRLDSFAIELGNNPNATAQIIVYGGKINKYNEFQERVKRIKYYLLENRKINPKRIKVIRGGFRDKFEFEFWISEVENSFPPLTPTIDPEKVIFKGKMKPLPLDLGN